jgi:hypothetical protein
MGWELLNVGKARSIGRVMVAIAVGLSSSLLGHVTASADYGTTPALQVPWATGTSWNVSGFTYGSAGQTCDGVPTTHTNLEKFAIDFGLTNGTEVDAAANGTVAATGSTSLGGTYVWLKHPNGMQTYYGHLSEVDVTSGNVSKGQRIALSGNSGPSGTGYHLHFRVSTSALAWDKLTNAFDTTNLNAYKPEPMSGTGPPGYTGWDNYGCNINTTATFTSTPPNEQVGVAPNLGVGTEDLQVRGTTGAAFDTPTDSFGNPQNWQSLAGPVGGIVIGPPCAVWNSPGTRLDMYAIGSDGHPWRMSYSSGLWGSWAQQTGTSGVSETETISCVRSPGGTIDLFMRGTAGDGLHGYTNTNGDIVAWDSLGGLVKGAPSGAWNALQTRLDVYAIGTDDHPWHGVCTEVSSGCAPSYWTGWTGHDLVAIAGPAECETISSVRSPDGTVDVYVRGNTYVAWHGTTDANGNILGSSWENLGGVIKGAPTGKSIRSGGPDSIEKDVFVVGTADVLWEKTWLNGSWGVWQQLPGGGIAA